MRFSLSCQCLRLMSCFFLLFASETFATESDLWEHLGSKDVPTASKKTVIKVAPEWERIAFRAVKIGAEQGNLKLSHAKLFFDDGTAALLDIQKKIKEGYYTKEMPFKEHQSLKKIEIYFSAPTERPLKVAFFGKLLGGRSKSQLVLPLVPASSP